MYEYVLHEESRSKLFFPLKEENTKKLVPIAHYTKPPCSWLISLLHAVIYLTVSTQVPAPPAVFSHFKSFYAKASEVYVTSDNLRLVRANIRLAKEVEKIEHKRVCILTFSCLLRKYTQDEDFSQLSDKASLLTS